VNFLIIIIIIQKNASLTFVGQIKLVWKTKVTSHNIFVSSCLSSEMWETLKCFVESRKTKQPKLEKPTN
jgi:hypothetical protein